MSEIRAFLDGYRAARSLSAPEVAALPTVMETARVESYLSLVVLALQQHDGQKAMLFWGFIVTLMTWFDSHADWSAALGD